MSSIDLTKLKHIHFTGLKGVGLTALALCAQDLGIAVSGSDIEETFVTAKILRYRGLVCQKNFAPAHLPPNTDLVIYTAAHGGAHNPEVVFAKKLGLPAFNHGQAVGLFMAGKIGISVCGVGGKSTTAAMIATILEEARLRPSFAVGVGNIPALGTPGRYVRNSRYFVAEADEYFAAPPTDNTPKFLYQHPEIIVTTAIRYDHPDVYPDAMAVRKSYRNFFNCLPAGGTLIAGRDDPATYRVARSIRRPLLTYGLNQQADFRITRVRSSAQKTFFRLAFRAVEQDYVLNLPGEFNARNASAAIAAAQTLGVASRTCALGLQRFTGTMRRFEILGTIKGITLVDDYAHHPAEIQATLTAARDWFPRRRLIVIFQPHTFSRTKALFSDFARSFARADQTIILPIYASAREAADPDINSQQLVRAITGPTQALFQPSFAALLKYLRASVVPGDVILTLGAGDIFLTAGRLIDEL